MHWEVHKYSFFIVANILLARPGRSLSVAVHGLHQHKFIDLHVAISPNI